MGDLIHARARFRHPADHFSHEGAFLYRLPPDLSGLPRPFSANPIALHRRNRLKPHERTFLLGHMRAVPNLVYRLYGPDKYVAFMDEGVRHGVFIKHRDCGATRYEWAHRVKGDFYPMLRLTPIDKGYMRELVRRLRNQPENAMLRAPITAASEPAKTAPADPQEAEKPYTSYDEKIERR